MKHLPHILVLTLLVLLFGAWITPAPVHAAGAFDVNSTLDEPDANLGDGRCESTVSHLCTLRAAIMEANALAGADTINLPAGIYLLTIIGRSEDNAATGDLDVKGDLAINGAGAATTIVDANYADRVFDVFSQANLSVSRVTLRNGYDGVGGAINNYGTLNLTDSTLTGNSASTGGAINNNGAVNISNSAFSDNSAHESTIYNGHGAITVANSTFADNHSDIGSVIENDGDSVAVVSSRFNDNLSKGGGGAILNKQNHAMTVSGSVFSNNTGNNGGALSNYGNLTVDRSVIADNSGWFGGGMVNWGVLKLSNSTISGNYAGSSSGGGIANMSTLTVTNSTFALNSANLAYDSGGGAINNGGTAKIVNSTFYRNSAYRGGAYLGEYGQIINSTFLDNSAKLQASAIEAGFETVVKNSIVSGHSSVSNCYTIIGDGGHNIDNGASCGFFNNYSRSNTDPKLALAGLQNNGGPTMTIALQARSPAIDAAANQGCPATDQRGIRRPQDSNGDGKIFCDIGAYEVKATTPTRRPILVSPPSGSIVASKGVNLDWSNSPWAARYELEVHQASQSGPLVAKAVTITSNYTTPRFASGRKYFWRVRACNDLGCSAWTPFWSFVTR